MNLQYLIFLALALTSEEKTEIPSYKPKAPWYVLIGFAGGYSKYTTNLLPQVDKDGFQIDTDGVLSHYWDSVVGDIGFGWMYHEISGSSYPILNEEVKTYSPFFELNARYRFTDALSAGLSSRTLFGTDLGYGAETKKHKAALFMGPQIAYDIDFSQWISRVFVQAHTDLTLPERQIYNIQAGIQIGLEVPELSIAASEDETKEPEEAPNAGIIEVENDQVKLTLLAESPLYFDFAKPNPRAESLAFLEKLANIIGDNLKNWKSLSIEGHTDSQGPENYNLILSKARADSVKKILISHGIPAEKLTTQGFAARRPRVQGESLEAHRQNRRVEFRFLEVKNPTELQKILKKLNED